MSKPNLGRDDDGRPMLPATAWCNARSKQNSGYCKRPAGWGTDHVGSGRCKLHGGSTPNQQLTVKGNENLPLAVPATLREAAELRKLDPQLQSVDGEIAMLRTVLEKIEVVLSDDGEINPMNPAINTLLDLSERIGRLVERSHRIQMDRKMLVPAHRVVAFVEAVGKAMRENIEDEAVLEAIYKVLADADNLA